MTAEIRNVTEAELPTWIRSMRVTFLDDPGTPFTDAHRDWWRPILEPERTWGAFDDGRCVATLRTFGTTLTVPTECHFGAHHAHLRAAERPDDTAATIPADALTQVTVSATHRRQGLLTRMLTRSLADARDRGEFVSILRAAEWPIYGRFGYAVATQTADYTISSYPRPSVLAPRGAVRVAGCEPAELVEPATAVLDQRIRRQPGQIGRAQSYWARLLGLQGLPSVTRREPVCVVARDESGNPVGYAVWTADGNGWPTERIDITLHEFIANTTDAYRALWQYLIGVDLINGIKWRERALDEPLEWLLSDGRAARRERTSDSLWLRMLDVPAALSARRYAGEDQLTVEVVDGDAGGWAGGRYRLDGGPAHADCVVDTAATADLTLPQPALAALYLGGRTVWSLVESDLIEEHTPGAIARLARLFAPTDRAPWNATPF